MVRAVYYGPEFSEKLSELCSKGTTTGLVLGSVVDDKIFGVSCVETPAEIPENDGDPEPAKKNVNIDVTWMLEHATQVYKLLPGNSSEVWNPFNVNNA